MTGRSLRRRFRGPALAEVKRIAAALAGAVDFRLVAAGIVAVNRGRRVAEAVLEPRRWRQSWSFNFAMLTNTSVSS